MKKHLWLLALFAAVVVSSLVVLADSSANADSCSGGCTMQVPGATGFECHWVCAGASCHQECTPVGGYAYTSTNCVLFGSGGPCACPYEGQGLPIVSNSCPDPKP
jgi:hypothetical protein